MVTRGLLVTMDVNPATDPAVEAFLQSALPMAQQEDGTTAWFAVRFGRSEYGIMDVFPSETERDRHLNGPIAQALIENAPALLMQAPRIQKVNVLAEKLPLPGASQTVTKGLLLTFQAKQGHATQVEQFLRDAQPLVQAEPHTIAWFALDLGDGQYGIFDVFPDNSGRFAHLTGHVPRELAKHSLTLLGSVPDMQMIDIIAAKLPE